MTYFHIVKGVDVMALQPTLWRTCRALANRRRLSCLKEVVLRPGESVGEIAASVRLPQDQASLCLRALQARGLLHASRDGRWVRYFPWPDPLVPTAAEILVAMTRALTGNELQDKHIIQCLTAFTHPRRLAILGRLHWQGVLSFSVLMRSCRISSPALFRHLKKLQARGLVQETPEGWALASEREPLCESFLKLVSQTCEM